MAPCWSISPLDAIDRPFATYSLICNLEIEQHMKVATLINSLQCSRPSLAPRFTFPVHCSSLFHVIFIKNPHENSTIKKAITCSSLSSRYWFELRNSPSSLSPSFASLSCSLARRSRLNTCKVHFIKLSGFAWSPPCRPPSPNCQQALPSPPRV